MYVFMHCINMGWYFCVVFPSDARHCIDVGRIRVVFFPSNARHCIDAERILLWLFLLMHDTV